MAQRGQGRKAVQTAHFASVMGDNISDLVVSFSTKWIALHKANHF